MEKIKSLFRKHKTIAAIIWMLFSTALVALLIAGPFVLIDAGVNFGRLFVVTYKVLLIFVTLPYCVVILITDHYERVDESKVRIFCFCAMDGVPFLMYVMYGDKLTHEQLIHYSIFIVLAIFLLARGNYYKKLYSKYKSLFEREKGKETDP